MTLFSQRNGHTRTYSAGDLYAAINAELQTWAMRQLFYKEFGGVVLIEDKTEPNNQKRFTLDPKLKNPAAFFRRALVMSLDFDFDTAEDFLDNLPTVLNPRNRNDGRLDLFFDFLEVVYPLLGSLNYNAKTKKLLIDKKAGQKIFRDAINPDLALYKTPYTMLSNGQIVEISQKPVTDLVDQALLIEPSKNVNETTIIPLQNAASNYLSRGASIDQKKQAVRDLADALESIKSKVKEQLLTDDEKELFKIANQFAIRHNQNKQKSNYNKSIWYDWMFHVNLAALLTVIRILKEQE